jgi:protein-histidine pros-kinase
MGLRTKLNLLMITMAVLAIGSFALASTPFLRSIARDEVLQRSRILMESAAGTRKYTSEEIAPILAPMLGTKFFPQAVSAYAAVKNFALLRAANPDYTYAEPALNPTNSASRATDWEADIITDFRDNPSKTELIVERETHNGRILSLAHPIHALQPCLACHDTPEAAPASMIAMYGKDHGFGWKLDEIVAAQIVSVPMAVPLANAAYIRNVVIGVLAAVFLVLIVLLDLFLSIVVINPVKRMSTIAVEASMGNTDVPEFVRSGSDEIGTLSESFNRMRRSLQEALKLLSPGAGRI